ncbi:ABC transporter permease [Corynebacterium falsenii]
MPVASTMSVKPRNLATPRWLLPFAVVGLLVVAGPLVGLVASIPWSQVPQLVSTQEPRQAFVLSLVTATVSTVVCVVLGFPLSLWLRRWFALADRRGSGPLSGFSKAAVAAMQLLVYAPLVLSPVVSGLAMIFFWGRRGIVGGWLDSVGIHLAYTTLGVMMVQVFVSLPFFVATTVTALTAIPGRLEEAAATEGASRTETLRHIVIPLAAPGMATGAVLSFARSLSEFGATITFAGNIAGESRTIPLLVSLGLSSGDMDQALGACILLLGIYLFVIAAVAAVRVISAVSRASTASRISSVGRTS